MLKPPGVGVRPITQAVPSAPTPMSLAPPGSRCQVEAAAAVNCWRGWTAGGVTGGGVGTGRVACGFVAEAALGRGPVAEHPDPREFRAVPAGSGDAAAAGTARPPVARATSDATNRPRRANGFSMTLSSAD